MAHDQLEVEGQTTRRGGGRFVAAGVVGACVLGVGLGLWARPSSVERGDAPAPSRPEVEAALSDRRLQIVVDDSPAPMGEPLEVMPADTPGLLLAGPEAQPPLAEPMAPRGPPAGLMKVAAPVETALEPPVAAPVEILPAVVPAARVEPRPERPKAEKPKTNAAAAKAEKPKARKTEARKTEARKTEARKAGTRVAKAEPKPKKTAPARKLAKADKSEKTTRTAARRTDRPAKLAKARSAKEKVAREAKAEKARITKLVKAVKTAPKTLKATAERKKKRDVQLAEAQDAKRAKAKAAKAKVAEAKTRPRVEKASAPKKKPVPRGEGPMRVARSDNCVSADPGEALVCADPRLNQRDRQLQRALRDAEAAGVPASALRRQQERLRQARAAAARDGSWAVEDVYEARIAELNDLARDAREF